MEKLVNIRKERACSLCGKLHNIGAKMYYIEGKEPVYGDIEQVGAVAWEKQTGMKYFKSWYCYDDLFGKTLPPCS